MCFVLILKALFGDMCLFSDCVFIVGGEEDDNITQVKFSSEI